MLAPQLAFLVSRHLDLHFRAPLDLLSALCARAHTLLHVLELVHQVLICELHCAPVVQRVEIHVA